LFKRVRCKIFLLFSHSWGLGWGPPLLHSRLCQVQIPSAIKPGNNFSQLFLDFSPGLTSRFHASRTYPFLFLNIFFSQEIVGNPFGVFVHLAFFEYPVREWGRSTFPFAFESGPRTGLPGSLFFPSCVLSSSGYPVYFAYLLSVVFLRKESMEAFPSTFEWNTFWSRLTLWFKHLQDLWLCSGRPASRYVSSTRVPLSCETNRTLTSPFSFFFIGVISLTRYRVWPKVGYSIWIPSAATLLHLFFLDRQGGFASSQEGATPGRGIYLLLSPFKFVFSDFRPSVLRTSPYVARSGCTFVFTFFSLASQFPSFVSYGKAHASLAS